MYMCISQIYCNYMYLLTLFYLNCYYMYSSTSHLKLNSLESAVAEHLDHLHYINDILSLNVLPLNDILKDHLLNRLFVPLYVYSLFETTVEARKEEDTPRVSSKIALFLLSQVSSAIHVYTYMYTVQCMYTCTCTVCH